MHVKISHQFTKDAAVAKVKQMLTDAKPQLAGKATIDEERWDGDTLYFAFTSDGHAISGTVVVKDKEFDITAKLPLMMRMFEGRIEKMIQAQSAQMLK